MTKDARAAQLSFWVQNWLTANPAWPRPVGDLVVVSGDASFRRYFRQPLTQGSLIAVDAPPEKENCRPFIAIAEMLFQQGLCVPEVLAYSASQGFMLLTDLGDTLLRQELNRQSVNILYGAAMSALVQLQGASSPLTSPLPPYDRERLLTEMHLFTDWFIPQYLGLPLSSDVAAIFEQQFTLIADAALRQPTVFVHRDYHSRNLMLTPTGELGIIDFQDAVIGPVTYDLASLLRDAYVSWPAIDVARWVQQFRDALIAHGTLADSVSPETFMAWFDWMAAQRHLKVIGIFARLSLRDGKHGYLADIPLVYRYLIDEIAPYAELQPLHQQLVALLPVYLARYPSAQALLGDWV